jgi:hypothetical protein
MKNAALGVIGTLVIISAIYFLWPAPTKPHRAVHTYARWWVNPNSGKDTGTIVIRLDYDTNSPYKSWAPRYYVPMIHIDSIARLGSKVKDSPITTTVWSYRDTLFIIVDEHKNYQY